MISRPALTLSAIALCGLAFSTAAQAQPTEAQMAAIKSNCRSDYMAKCMSVKPGGPEAFQCLKKNEASLSTACKSAVNAIAAPAQEAKPAAAPAPAAAAPAHASPAPASPPPAAAAAPAAAPAVATSPAAPKPAAPKPAAAAAAPAQPSAAQQNAIKQSCRNDFMSHCSGVQPGGAAALNCLQTNSAKLTPACKGAVAAIGGAPAAAKPAAVAATPPAAAAPAAPPPAAMPAPRLNSPMEARIIREFCFTDFRVLCRGVKLGQGRALQCLASNAPALSPGCKAAMAQASR
jgi:hypothetical protein